MQLEMPTHSFSPRSLVFALWFWKAGCRPKSALFFFGALLVAAVHATRRFVMDMEDDHAFLKLDFRNAFNSIRRDKVLEAVQDLCPDIYPLVHSSY